MAGTRPARPRPPPISAQAQESHDVPLPKRPKPPPPGTVPTPSSSSSSSLSSTATTSSNEDRAIYSTVKKPPKRYPAPTTPAPPPPYEGDALKKLANAESAVLSATSPSTGKEPTQLVVKEELSVKQQPPSSDETDGDRKADATSGSGLAGKPRPPRPAPSRPSRPPAGKRYLKKYILCDI